MSRPAKVTIDLAAARHNLQIIKQYAPQAQILAVLKANAYGHGMENVAHALQAADGFGVCCLEEALELREFGIKKPILLMEGFFHADEIPLIAKHDLQTVIHHWLQIIELKKSKIKKPLKIWLKLDSGMHRLGFLPEEYQQVYTELMASSKIEKPIVLMSHFSSSDELKNPLTTMQHECFISVTQSMIGERSLANSAAILAWPTTHNDWVRPGIMLYGISPFSNQTGLDFKLKPVMTLSSELIAIHALRKGDPVGYGAIWRCPEDMLVGVVGMGYGDGYPRNAEMGTPVLVNNKIVPLAGRVSMDMLTVDLRTQPDAKVGDPVVLWGEGLPVEKIAAYSRTIAYELVCGIKKRVKVSLI